jgi:hypothetical protein
MARFFVVLSALVLIAAPVRAEDGPVAHLIVGKLFQFEQLAPDYLERAPEEAYSWPVGTARLESGEIKRIIHLDLLVDAEKSRTAQGIRNLFKADYRIGTIERKGVRFEIPLLTEEGKPTALHFAMTPLEPAGYELRESDIDAFFN